MRLASKDRLGCHRRAGLAGRRRVLRRDGSLPRVFRRDCRARNGAGRPHVVRKAERRPGSERRDLYGKIGAANARAFDRREQCDARPFPDRARLQAFDFRIVPLLVTVGLAQK